MSEDSRPAELFQLDRATCLALLTTQHVGRLIIDAAEPVSASSTTPPSSTRSCSAPIPVRRSTPSSTKPVVFEADMVDERTRSGWSVVVRGIARDVSEHLAGLGQTAANVEPWAPGPKNRWIGIDIDDVTGRLLRGEVASTWVNPEAYM